MPPEESKAEPLCVRKEDNNFGKFLYYRLRDECPNPGSVEGEQYPTGAATG